MNLDIDYGEIQQALESGTEGSGLDFAGLVEEFFFSGEGLSAKGLLGLFLEHITLDITEYRTLLIQIAGISIGAAMCKGMTDSFHNRQVGQTSFFVTYLLLFSLILSGFLASFEIAKSVIGWVVDFMEALVPAYALSVAFCTGSATSLMFYQGILLAISLVEFVFLKVLLPMVHVYLVFRLLNYFSGEEPLGQLADMLRQIVRWGAKTLFGLVIGIQAVQGMILPMSDQVKRSTLYKTVELLPGVGGAIGSMTETVLGTGLLVKNSIGAAGLVALLLVCLVPLGKLVASFFVYKLSAGVLEPISDKRVISGLAAAAEGTGLLLYLTGTTILLFALTISLVAFATGVH